MKRTISTELKTSGNMQNEFYESTMELTRNISIYSVKNGSSVSTMEYQKISSKFLENGAQLRCLYNTAPKNKC